MRKAAAAAQASPGRHAKEKQRADDRPSQDLREPPALTKFKADPVEGGRSMLRLRSRATIEEVLAHAEFVTALTGLAAKATNSPKAAVILSRFALRAEFSGASAAAMGAAAPWPEPSEFGADERRLAADALERTRPSWASLWLAKALLQALPRPDLRRFFASRLLLASGGLAGTVDALAKSLMALKSEKKKAGRDHLTLIRELRSCVRPAAAIPSTAATAFADFIRTVIADRTAADDAQVKSELAQLLLGAALADRSLLLDEKILEGVATLDRDVATELRAGAAGLRPQEVRPAARPSPPRPPSTPSASSTPSPPPVQADLMREAASSESDEALGRALQDMGGLERQFEQLAAAVEGQAADRARRAKGASELVLQWVRQAGRHRNIAALGKRGDHVPFDPQLHQVDDEVSPGDTVRVVKPPIVRTSGTQQIVLVRGEVELD